MLGKVALAVGLVLLLVATPRPARAEPPVAPLPRRNLISPDETGSMPRGFHAETRPRYGAIIGGAVTTGLGSLMLITGLEQRRELNADTSNTPHDPGSGGEFFIISGGVALAVGLPLLAYGLLSPRDVYVRDVPSSVHLSFVVEPRRVGAGLTFAF
jgi:hypothetical protein